MSCCLARHGKQLRDEAIEEERQNEREIEREVAQYNTPDEIIIDHFSHPHPLSYIDTNHSDFLCNSCRKRGNRRRYHCAQCNFNLHIICTQNPLTWLLPDKSSNEINPLVVPRQKAICNSFAHPQHSLISEYRTEFFKCSHCYDSGNGLRFRCDACNVVFHEVCVKHPTKLASYFHEHELELNLRSCYHICKLCQHSGRRNNFVYTCKTCQFYVHPNCIAWPLYVIHPLHREHPLVLQPCAGHVYNCSVCDQKADRYKYSCQVCELDFDPVCIWQKSELKMDEELKRKYGDKIIMLPIKNLSSPYNFSMTKIEFHQSPAGFSDPSSIVVSFLLCCPF